jgi:ribosome-associated toxin RatA of RatAB toxin-antitoxin module
MPTVVVEVELAAVIDDVWRLIRDVEAYPRLMEPVRAVHVLEETGPELLTAWEVELKGSILKWTEREVRDEFRRRIDYEQVDGDLETFDGYWQLHPIGEAATKAVLHVDFEIGVPMLREMLDPVAERAIRQNARKMLLSLAPPLERHDQVHGE